MAGRKSSHFFFLTLPQANHLEKRDVADVLLPICSSVIVGQERHQDGGTHYHAVFKTLDGYFLTQILDYLRGYFGADAAIDLQVPRVNRTVVHYCCKEDLDPIIEGDDFKKDLPFSVCAMEFVKSNATFSLVHPFVIAHWTSYRFLESLHQEYWATRYNPVELPSCVRAVRDEGIRFAVGERLFLRSIWAQQVVDWVQEGFRLPRAHKSRQLYLYGVPNCGKTTLMRSLVDFSKGFLAGRDKWWFEGFSPSLHGFVILDEFDYPTFSCKKELLKCLAGEPFVANVKGKSPLRVDVNLPVIMITNEDPPEDAAFRVRVMIVYADDKCYE